MNKFLTISLVICFLSISVFAQKSINSYKYILVPKQFEFQKSEDQYQLNSLTKFLFKRANYTVLFTDDQYPEDLKNNSCLALRVKLNNKENFLKTKMNFDLYNCENNIVFSTKEATSNLKDYKKAYHEAIRRAFVELEDINYKYDSSLAHTSKNEIKVTKILKTENEVQVEKKNKVEKKTAQIKVTEPVKETTIKEIEKKLIKTIEGKFYFENWGESIISKKDYEYTVIGGDENFEFATIYKTLKPTLFIIKWVAFKRPQLLEIDKKGNLKIETENGTHHYKRVN